MGDLLAAEIAVHQRLVLGLLDDALDQGSAEVVVGAVVDHQVEQPGHLLAVAHRDVEGQHLVAERLLGGGQHAVVVGAGVVELGDHHGAWHRDLGALAPQGGGGVVDGLVGADHEQRAVGGAQSGAHLTDEVGVAGGVDEVDLGLPVDDRRDGQRDGALVGVLELLEVADGAALGDGSRSGDGSGGGEQRLDQGGLPGPTGSDQHHVADPVGAARPEILPGWSATACPVSHLRLRCSGGPGRAAGSRAPRASVRGTQTTPPGPDVQGVEGHRIRRGRGGEEGSEERRKRLPDADEPLAAWGQRGARYRSGCMPPGRRPQSVRLVGRACSISATFSRVQG